MQRFDGTTTDLDGTIRSGMTVTVTDFFTGALASLFSGQKGGAIANPLTSDAQGRFSFYAPNGEYNISITDGPSFPSKQLFDPTDIGSIIDATNYGFVQGDTGVVDRTSSFVNAIAAISQGGTLVMPAGIALITQGQVTNKSFIIQGPSHASGFKFVPSTPNDTFIKWQRTGAVFPSKNEEGNLEGPGLKNIGIYSNRSVRANGVHFLNCDHTILDDVYFFGLDGYAINNDRSREALNWHVQTRYCGHYEDTDTINCVPSVTINSTTAGGDTSNLMAIDEIATIYSYWHNLVVDSSTDIMFGNILTHGVIEGGANVETVVCQQFGGTPGFTSFVPNNSYAALHTSVSGNESNVTGLKFKPLGKRRCNFLSAGSRGNIGFLKAPGTNSLITNRIDDGSLWTLSGAFLDGAESATTFTVPGTTFTVSGNVATFGASIDLFTGDPVNVVSSSALPSPLANPNGNMSGNGRLTTYYYIRLSDTTGSLATTYRNAIAGTAITLTDAGSGTLTMQYLNASLASPPAVLGLVGGSSVNADGRVNLATGRNMLLLDDKSWFDGAYTTTSSNANDVSRAAPTEVIVGFMRGAWFSGGSGLDQAFNMQNGGHRYSITRIEVKNPIGSAHASTWPIGGIYTAVSKGGTVVVNASYEWTGIISHKTCPIPISDSMPGVILVGTTALYLHLDQNNLTGLFADVYVYGTLADGLS